MDGREIGIYRVNLAKEVPERLCVSSSIQHIGNCSLEKRGRQSWGWAGRKKKRAQNFNRIGKKGRSERRRGGLVFQDSNRKGFGEERQSRAEVDTSSQSR